MKSQFFCILLLLFLSLTLHGKVSVSSLFSDHGVIQRGVPVKVWGWANPAEKISINFVGMSLKTVADSNGNWSVTFPAQEVGKPQTMHITGENSLVINDLVFGEVWLASGQSNMGWSLGKTVDGDLEVLLANDPLLRVIKVSNRGSQVPNKDIQGSWAIATDDIIKGISAVGYYFGRDLRRALGVPVGIIVNPWGGSSAEAWVPRKVLEADPRYRSFLLMYDKKVANYNHAKTTADFEKKLANWKTLNAKAIKAKKPRPQKPEKPRDPRYDQRRPANLWNSRIYPLLNYGIKGVIWYQGETNTGRSYDYRYLLPTLIKTWRDHWGLGEFPFYWAQLANYGQKERSPKFSSWAEIRESMTLTKGAVANTGQAVITDLGEAKDVHPRRKLEVGKRLLRWALANEYGFNLICKSPEFLSYEIQSNKIIVTLDQPVKTLDVKAVQGFSIAGKDQVFMPANAMIKGMQIAVWNDDLVVPQAVRYNWKNDPDGNVISKIDLPLTSFRTDSWKLKSQTTD